MTKVKLRMKSISANRKTLYLDYYPPILHPTTGKFTRREFLKLYINEKPKTETDRIHNKETVQLAEVIKAKRQLSLQRSNFGFLSNERTNTDFVNYFRSLAMKRSGSNSDNWLSALHHLEEFTKGRVVPFKNLNEFFCNDFKEYLLSAPSRKSKNFRLSQNSSLSYFNKLKASLKQAYKDGYLDFDLNKKIECIKQAETERQFLTLDELKVLTKTNCNNNLLKNACLFSAYTGLRFSDIEKLTWGEIQFDSNNGYYIRFRQKKTRRTETLPISENAFLLLGERCRNEILVFKHLSYSSTQSDLPKWLKKAGIQKHITFHSFRHSFATLQLTLGTDIYTISGMLGHRNLKTTQIYAKIIDQKKREAANRISF